MRFRVLLSSLLLILATSATFAAPTANEIIEAYNSGQAAWDDGDLVTAMTRLKLPADNGHAEAQALLGYILDQADNDVEAAGYYRKAADQNNYDGMFGLAAFHLSGDGDVKVDPAAAKALYLRAAEGRHVPSVSVIVLSHVNGGLGFTEAERTGAGALKWYTLGEELGLTVAVEQLIDAHRNGKLGLPQNPEEADRLQTKLYAIMGIDPSTIKKKRRRR